VSPHTGAAQRQQVWVSPTHIRAATKTAAYSSAASALLFLAEFLEARIVSERIEHRIERE